jgi:hypothetical protein
LHAENRGVMPTPGKPPFDRPTALLSNHTVWMETLGAQNLKRVASYLRTLHETHRGEDLPQKYLLPLSIPANAERRGHAMLIVLDWEPGEKRFHTTVLEQHMNPRDSQRDFTRECAALGIAMRDTLHGPAHYNREFFCRVPSVCGIVQAEARKTIALSEKPGWHFAQNPHLLAMDEPQARHAYAQHRQLAHQRATAMGDAHREALSPAETREISQQIHVLIEQALAAKRPGFVARLTGRHPNGYERD